jgi:hypothetical protein
VFSSLGARFFRADFRSIGPLFACALTRLADFPPDAHNRSNPRGDLAARPALLAQQVFIGPRQSLGIFPELQKTNMSNFPASRLLLPLDIEHSIR